MSRRIDRWIFIVIQLGTFVGGGEIETEFVTCGGVFHET